MEQDEDIRIENIGEKTANTSEYTDPGTIESENESDQTFKRKHDGNEDASENEIDRHSHSDNEPSPIIAKKKKKKVAAFFEAVADESDGEGGKGSDDSEDSEDDEDEDQNQYEKDGFVVSDNESDDDEDDEDGENLFERNFEKMKQKKELSRLKKKKDEIILDDDDYNLIEENKNMKKVEAEEDGDEEDISRDKARIGESTSRDAPRDSYMGDDDDDGWIVEDDDNDDNAADEMNEERNKSSGRRQIETRPGGPTRDQLQGINSILAEQKTFHSFPKAISPLINNLLHHFPLNILIFYIVLIHSFLILPIITIPCSVLAKRNTGAFLVSWFPGFLVCGAEAMDLFGEEFLEFDENEDSQYYDDGMLSTNSLLAQC